LSNGRKGWPLPKGCLEVFEVYRWNNRYESRQHFFLESDARKLVDTLNKTKPYGTNAWHWRRRAVMHTDDGQFYHVSLTPLTNIETFCPLPEEPYQPDWHDEFIREMQEEEDHLTGPPYTW
jgi:hypothetical protein